MSKTINFKKSSTAFIPFIMAGYPNLETTKELVIGLEKIGADAIEIGVPFSDPIGDGPTNIQAADIALKNDVNLKTVLNFIKNLRSNNVRIPIILFTYYNPAFKMGTEEFCKQVKISGVDMVLIIDLPMNEFPDFYRLCKHFQIGTILLASPTATDEQLSLYNQYELPFVYYISRLGVTGEKKQLSKTLESEVKHVKSIIKHPICVGFGISTPEQVKDVSRFTDGVIVGSALVKLSHDKTKFLALAQELVDQIVD